MPEFITNPSDAIIWMYVGIALILIEVSIMPTMALLFAGLGGLTLGGLMANDVITTEKIMLQLAMWFGFTIAWATLLWVPLKKARERKRETFNDMVGSQATVAGKPLNKGKSGKVLWSGTTMKARLSEEADTTSVSVGEEVTIIKVEGGVLYVSP